MAEQEKITLGEYHRRLMAQEVPPEHAAVVCAMCKSVQSPFDFIRAEAGKNYDEVAKYLGYSCIGRWTHELPPPAKDKVGDQYGCNWTLGGLFKIGNIQVEMSDGQVVPAFEPASAEEAQKHMKENLNENLRVG